MMKKSTIALGIAGAMLLATPGLSLAAKVHHTRHAPSYSRVAPPFGYGFNAYGAYGPRWSNGSGPYGSSRRTTWDPYAKRYDDDN